MKKVFLSTVLSLLFFALLTGCKKDKTSTSGKSVRYTITITGATSADYVSVVFSGGTLAGEQTIWKVDGQTKNNEMTIALNEDDFGTGKTFVVETVKPVLAAAATLQCLQPANNGRTYKLSFKAEVNGQIKTNDQNITVGYNSDYTHQYSY